MDFEKLKQWMELAQQVQGEDFWTNIFGQETVHSTNANQRTENNHETREKVDVSESTTNETFPKVDIYLSFQELIILIDLPGVQREDVKISSSNNQLFIKGYVSHDYKDVTIVQGEKFRGHFERVIELPESIQNAKSKAKMQNGILEIRFQRFTPSQVDIRID